MRSFLLLFLTGAAAAQAPSFKAVGNLKQLMRGILLPNSDAVFNVARRAPQNEKEWTAIEDSAVALAEAANLILVPGRRREKGEPVPVERADWRKYTQELLEAGEAAHKAARSKSQEAVVAVGDRLSEACESCHQVYRDKPEPRP